MQSAISLSRFLRPHNASYMECPEFRIRSYYVSIQAGSKTHFARFIYKHQDIVFCRSKRGYKYLNNHLFVIRLLYKHSCNFRSNAQLLEKVNDHKISLYIRTVGDLKRQACSWAIYSNTSCSRWALSVISELLILIHRFATLVFIHRPLLVGCPSRACLYWTNSRLTIWVICLANYMPSINTAHQCLPVARPSTIDITGQG